MLQVVNRLGQPRLPHHIHSSCTSDNSNYYSSCKSNIQITIPIQVRNIQIFCSNILWSIFLFKMQFSSLFKFITIWLVTNYSPIFPHDIWNTNNKQEYIGGIQWILFILETLLKQTTTHALSAQRSGNQRRFGQMWKCKRFER